MSIKPLTTTRQMFSSFVIFFVSLTHKLEYELLILPISKLSKQRKQ